MRIERTEEFAHLLRRERLLSDRTQVPFSLVSLEFTPADSVPAVEKALLSRLRLSDTAGWVRPGVLGLLLPGTSGDGARQLLERAEREGALARCGLSRTRFAIAQYPDERRATTPDASDRPGAPGDDGSVGPAEPRPEETILALTSRGLPRWKRGLDVVLASAAVLILSPLLLLIALVIRLGSAGPVLYRQRRVGAGGCLFEMYKFRTFRLDGDGGAHERYVRELIRSSAEPGPQPMLKLPSTGSLVPGGRFLRAWGLDELPQLLNILRGDMTIVGPRPEVPYALSEYRPWHHQRFDTVPGLTGLWQVSGKNRLSFREMVRLDVRYTRTTSPLMDLWIMLRTVPALVSYNRPGSRRTQDQTAGS